MIFDADAEFSSPMSPSVAYLWRPGRHLTQNWSKMMKNDDSQNHVLDTQGVSWSHQGHPRRSLDVFWCIWHVFEIFHFLVKIMIFTHHDSCSPVMMSHPNSCAPGGECFAPLSLTEGVPQVMKSYQTTNFVSPQLSAK